MPRAGWQWKSFSRFIAGKDWNEQPVTRPKNLNEKNYFVRALNDQVTLNSASTSPVLE